MKFYNNICEQSFGQLLSRFNRVRQLCPKVIMVAKCRCWMSNFHKMDALQNNSKQPQNTRL